MSLAIATAAASIANYALLLSLITGVFATFVIVKASDRKEELWDREKRLAENRIASINFESLTLQRVMLPRHLASGVLNDVCIKYPGVKVLLGHVAPDDEAASFVGEIQQALIACGWKAQGWGAGFSSLEGLSVSYLMRADRPRGSGSAVGEYPKQTALDLAESFTKQGFGVGDMPVPVTIHETLDEMSIRNLKSIDMDPADAVFIFVGARPVASTIKWMQGRNVK